jgi:hypothetical protein
MAEGGTHSVTELREIAAKAKASAAKIKDRVEEIGQNGAGLVVGGVAAAGCGFVDQRWGRDMGAGVKQHYIGPAPSTLTASAGLLGLTLFGAFGKVSHVGWDLTKSTFNSYMNTMGRIAEVQLEARKNEKKDESSAPSKPAKKTGTDGK